MNILTCNADNMVHDANCLMFERFLGRSNEPHEPIQETSSISRLLHHGDHLVRHRKQCASAFQCRLIYRRTKCGGTNESGRWVCVLRSRPRIYTPQFAARVACASRDATRSALPDGPSPLAKVKSHHDAGEPHGPRTLLSCGTPPVSTCAVVVG